MATAIKTGRESKDRQSPKFVTIMGTTNGVGTTTIANYVAVELARRNNSTLLIEFSKKTGYSVYMQKGLTEVRRSLSEAMMVPERLNDNTIRSGHSKSLRYLCMNFRDDSLKMLNYREANITRIVSIAKSYFDYIILDLPSDTLESIVPVVYSSMSDVKPDIQIVVTTEQANSFKYLNDFNCIMRLANEGTVRETTFVLNSVESAHYQDYITEYLSSLPITKPVNSVYLPRVPGLSVICNKGEIYQMGVNSTTKLFCSQIDKIADIIEFDLKNIKSDLNELQSKEKSSFLGSIFGSFMSKKSDETEETTGDSKKSKHKKPKSSALRSKRKAEKNLRQAQKQKKDIVIEPEDEYEDEVIEEQENYTDEYDD